MLWVIAVLTLVGGSVMAVVQTNVKRMLAFSSISHAGFILVGIEAAAHAGTGASRGLASVLFYVITYAVLVSGTFAVATAVGRNGDAEHSLDAYKGLGRQRPALALGGLEAGKGVVGHRGSFQSGDRGLHCTASG